MPFREKAKNLFKSRRTSNISERSPSDLYYTEANMPRPKYRGIPKKEHTEKLEAFSFGDAWRKRSFQSMHSPGGTRASSRRGSKMIDAGPKSFGGKDIKDHSRASSVVNEGTEHGGLRHMPGMAAHVASPLREQEGDDSVAIVGRSNEAAARPRTAEDAKPNGLYKTMSTAHDHTPFTEQDLALAMQRSRMQVAAQ